MNQPQSVTLRNLESAFAGESMAHIKYRYFARIAREQGDEETARVFEATADQALLLAPRDAGVLDDLPAAAVDGQAPGTPARRPVQNGAVRASSQASASPVSRGASRLATVA